MPSPQMSNHEVLSSSLILDEGQSFAGPVDQVAGKRTKLTLVSKAWRKRFGTAAEPKALWSPS